MDTPTCEALKSMVPTAILRENSMFYSQSYPRDFVPDLQRFRVLTGVGGNKGRPVGLLLQKWRKGTEGPQWGPELVG